MNRSAARPWRSALLLLAGLIALSVIAIEPPPSKEEIAATQNPSELAPGENGGPGGTSTDPNAPGSGTAGTPGAPGSRTGGPGARTGNNLECKAGRNGGNTDPKGVSGNRIKLAATNVRSGTGSSFLGTSYIGMQAVVNRVNAQGGVCGRLLELRMVDDGWEAPRGANFIASFAKEGYFALPVVPSSEGLTLAITNKTISNAGIPVVGTDGMLKEQYFDPWVWPVATSTVSTMRIMAKHAYDKGARSFGIIFDNTYRFGEEGAAAYRTYVQTLGGANLKAYVGIDAGKPSYSGEAQKFNSDCGGSCDFVAMLLTPETAATYIASQQTDQGGKKLGFGRMLTGGAQPLFNERFGRDCGRPCDSMVVWTGYNPPIGRLASLKDVAAYTDDVRSVDPGVDISNQFLQGAYLGMKAFVAALEKTGPNLTRGGVRDAMNSMTFTSDLSSPLTWAPNQRFANLSAQPFRIVTSSSSFAGFAEEGSGFIKDPTPGVVPK